MKWLVRSFFGLSAVAAVVLIGGLFLPARAHVERTIAIDRPPATVFTLLSNLHTYHEWSPWAHEEPGAIFGFEGPDFGVGAEYLWSGARIGSGEMVITRADPYEKVEASVDLGPRGQAVMTFAVEPKPGGSTVIWTYDADFGLNLIGRYVGRFFDLRLGDAFEAGLVNFKELAESLPGADFADADAEVVTIMRQPAVIYAGQIRGDAAEQDAEFARSLAVVRQAIADAGLREAGPPIAVTERWQPPLWEFEAMIPYGGEPEGDLNDEVTLGSTPAGRAARLVYHGPREDVGPLETKLQAFIAAHRLHATGLSWEVYVTASDTPPEDQVTELYIAVE